MKSKRKIFLALIFLIPLTVIFSQCLTLSPKSNDPRGDSYVGAAKCMQCHKEIYDDYLHTAHFSSTRLADSKTMHGDFTPGHNVYYFSKDLKVVMEKHKDGFYQVAYFKGKQINSARFDVVFGGVKAESYLYWKDNELFQLPISYFNALQNWTDSPGFDTLNANYGRMIGDRCFQCHSSYIRQIPSGSQSIANPVIKYDKASLIMGIDCERCHGPGADHVNFQMAHPDDKKAHFMVSYTSLPRARKLDMCAICHSGNKETLIKNIFAFKPGDTLASYKEVDFFQSPAVDSAKLDVHGNQYQLLSSSKCFIKSNLDCATCHNVHANQRQDVALFSQKCMDCHKTSTHNFCPMAQQLGGVIKTNCIDCHMPARSSSVIAVQTSGKGRAVPYLVRTHHIAIYKDATQAVINNFKKTNKLQTN
ncbi:MAG: hypothetical protein ACTHNW_00490 [Mucilaginibacter sp.]